MRPPAPLAVEAAGCLAARMADTQDRAMVEQLIRTRKEGGKMPSLAILPPLAQVAYRILHSDGTDDAAQHWLRQGRHIMTDQSELTPAEQVAMTQELYDAAARQVRTADQEAKTALELMRAAGRHLSQAKAREADSAPPEAVCGPCGAGLRRDTDLIGSWLSVGTGAQQRGVCPADTSGSPARPHVPAGTDLGSLTERRKGDRAVMAAHVAQLARAHGLRAEVYPEQDGTRRTSVGLGGPHGLRLAVRFRGSSLTSAPDTYVLSWFGVEDGWKLFPPVFGGSVNPYHGHKATDVVRGFAQLLTLLGRRFASIADGSAFVREQADGHMSARGKLDRWVPGPFVVMTLGQRCYQCSADIAPGSTAYRCPDGEVRCGSTHVPAS